MPCLPGKTKVFSRFFGTWKEYKIKLSRMSPNRIFMFLINLPSGNVGIQKLIAKHIFECFEKRKTAKVNTVGLN